MDLHPKVYSNGIVKIKILGFGFNMGPEYGSKPWLAPWSPCKERASEAPLRQALPGSPRFAGKYDDPEFPGGSEWGSLADHWFIHIHPVLDDHYRFFTIVLLDSIPICWQLQQDDGDDGETMQQTKHR